VHTPERKRAQSYARELLMSHDTPPHGHGLAGEDHELLRSEPPERALSWSAAALGRGARVVRVWALEGGASSAVHALDVRDRLGRTRSLVLRRLVRPEWLAEEPLALAREAAALELVRGSEVRTPELVSVDVGGTEAGEPALLMTRLAGGIEWHPADLESFLHALAVALPRIHATPLPTDPGVPPYDPYELELARPPRWASQPVAWQRAMELFKGPAPLAESCFIHRDYHPGNVLWADGELAGVVDWVHASVGSPDADVGYCRANLAGRFGLEAADRFLDHYQAIAGRSDFHPYWDIAAALGGFSEEHFDRNDERFLAHALRRL
jgi:aminoglycoside phosphotransferase (APT) family kinase protein